MNCRRNRLKAKGFWVIRPASAARQWNSNANAIPISRVRVRRHEMDFTKDSETGQVHVLYTKTSGFRFVPALQLGSTNWMIGEHFVTTWHHVLTYSLQTGMLCLHSDLGRALYERTLRLRCTSKRDRTYYMDTATLMGGEPHIGRKSSQ